MVEEEEDSVDDELQKMVEEEEDGVDDKLQKMVVEKESGIDDKLQEEKRAVDEMIRTIFCLLYRYRHVKKYKNGPFFIRRMKN